MNVGSVWSWCTLLVTFLQKVWNYIGVEIAHRNDTYLAGIEIEAALLKKLNHESGNGLK